MKYFLTFICLSFLNLHSTEMSWYNFLKYRFEHANHDDSKVRLGAVNYGQCSNSNDQTNLYGVAIQVNNAEEGNEISYVFTPHEERADFIRRLDFEEFNYPKFYPVLGKGEILVENDLDIGKIRTEYGELYLKLESKDPSNSIIRHCLIILRSR